MRIEAQAASFRDVHQMSPHTLARRIRRPNHVSGAEAAAQAWRTRLMRCRCGPRQGRGLGARGDLAPSHQRPTDFVMPLKFARVRQSEIPAMARPAAPLAKHRLC